MVLKKKHSTTHLILDQVKRLNKKFRIYNLVHASMLSVCLRMVWCSPLRQGTMKVNVDAMLDHNTSWAWCGGKRCQWIRKRRLSAMIVMVADGADMARGANSSC